MHCYMLSHLGRIHKHFLARGPPLKALGPLVIVVLSSSEEWFPLFSWCHLNNWKRPEEVELCNILKGKDLWRRIFSPPVIWWPLSWLLQCRPLYEVIQLLWGHNNVRISSSAEILFSTICAINFYLSHLWPLPGSEYCFYPETRSKMDFSPSFCF